MAQTERSPSRACESWPSSRELIRRVREGDSSAADRLFARYLPQLHHWAHRRMPRWARGILDTGDLVNETVLHTYRHLRTFEPQREGALLGYLRRSLLNRIRDQIRQTARRPAPMPFDDHHPDPAASPLDAAISWQNRDRYLRGLRRLKPEERNAIIGRLELHYSYEQLALALAKPTAEAARLTVRRALLRLAREMEHV